MTAAQIQALLNQFLGANNPLATLLQGAGNALPLVAGVLFLPWLILIGLGVWWFVGRGD